MPNRNSEKCKHLSTVTVFANLNMEIQMNKIIQKKGETEEEYKRNQELITHKLGNLIPKSHYGYNFL